MKLNQLSVKDLSIKEFLIGGLLFSVIKYTADNVADIRISSMIAAFPIGLLSSLLIADNKIQVYSLSYTKSISILLLTSIVFCLLHSYTDLHRHFNLIISIIFWLLINSLVINFT